MIEFKPLHILVLDYKIYYLKAKTKCFHKIMHKYLPNLSTPVRSATYTEIKYFNKLKVILNDTQVIYFSKLLLSIQGGPSYSI